VTPVKPFARSGVDYCGPIYIKSGQHRNAKLIKVYISIFICLCTKAIHIELVSDLMTDAFLNALKRFLARRRKISHLFSDTMEPIFKKHQTRSMNCINYCTAELIRRRLMLKEDNIEWHFIPPHAPHFGGIWESAIKSAKYYLKRIVGDAALNFEEMYTALVLIKAVLNSCPLTPISNDPNDFSYLTPGHFLVGDSLISICKKMLHIYHLIDCRDGSVSIRFINIFGDVRVLNQLQQRNKWRQSKDLQ